MTESDHAGVRCAAVSIAAPACRAAAEHDRIPHPACRHSPLVWNASPDWKLDYCNIERLTPEEIARRRAEFDQGKTQAKSVREAVGVSCSDAEDEIA